MFIISIFIIGLCIAGLLIVGHYVIFTVPYTLLARLLAFVPFGLCTFDIIGPFATFGFYIINFSL